MIARCVALREDDSLDIRLIARILLTRARLRARELWSRSELEAHQTRALAALREHAVTRSRVYRRFHRGLEELPVLTKREFKASFDELVTEPEIRHAEVERHLAALQGDERYLGRY